MSDPSSTTLTTDAGRPTDAGVWSRLVGRLPVEIGRGTRVLAWLVLISNVVIVGTGGLVRLTGSGMGCETWPYCTAGSLTPTDELGIHGLIEFGNRTLTGVLVIVSLLAFLSVVRLWNSRPELPRLTLAIGLGIILQAVIGGITVWLH
ncbi:MAG TPA: COX15/CtaA family protein, partial [Microbacterium sp.]|nr:COX15/CtaA family protein [Microbacterium sp.]